MATQEPTDTSIGKLIRSLLAGKEKISPNTMARLFAADRYEHVFRPESGIKDQLQAGTWVISDRYVFSSLAYQGPQVGFDEVYAFNKDVLLPDYTFFLTIPADKAMQRLGMRESLDLYETTEFQTQVAKAYSKAFLHYADTDCKIVEIDATMAIQDIHGQICRHLNIMPINVE